MAKIDHIKRRQLGKRFGPLYKRDYSFDYNVCCYCGVSKQCIDHCPPISLLENIDLKEYYKNGGKLTLFPSCTQCNSMLRDRPLITYYERLDYLSHRYIKILDKMETWTNRELSEMGPTLRAFITASQVKVQIHIRKLEVIEENRLKHEDYN